MNGSIRAMFPYDDHALGPFLGKLPPDVIDEIVKRLGWFRTTFAMAGKTCREIVERVGTRAVLTEEERTLFRSPEFTPLAVAVVDGDVEALEWLIQLFDRKGLMWRPVGEKLSYLAAKRGKIEMLMWRKVGEGLSYLAVKRGEIKMLAHLRRATGCTWDKKTCAAAVERGHLEVLKYAHENGCPWDEETCEVAAREGHLEVLKYAHENGCPWDEMTWWGADSCCQPYLIEHGCPGADGVSSFFTFTTT